MASAESGSGVSWVGSLVEPTSKTVDMRSLTPSPAWRPGDPIVDIPRRMGGDSPQAEVPSLPPTGHDLLADRQRLHRGAAPSNLSSPLININTIANTNVNPNDPTMDVGTLQVVVAINSLNGAEFVVYDKITGSTVVPRSTMRQLGAGFPCGTNGNGDAIVLFDEIASRWLLTEFAPGSNVLCTYLSDRADLSGTVVWSHYVFNTPGFPDYPKYGVWPNAYFVAANEAGTSGERPVYALDRLAMLAFQPASLQRFTTPRLAGFLFEALQPADIAGSDLLPLSMPGLFLRHYDDEAHDPANNDPKRDFLELFELHVDFAQPANSRLEGPTRFKVAEFSSNLVNLSTFFVFPQPNGIRLDALREQVMHRAVYRRYPGYESIVANHVTDLFLGPESLYPDDTGAVRWYELRRGGQASELLTTGFEANDTAGRWALHQQGTYAPEDAPGVPADQADRWMAAMSLDAVGNIGMAYNIVRDGSTPIPAGIRFTGRLASDPLGVMTAPETVIVNGSGSIGGARWGDYNDMGVDPVDGCTFWFAGNYTSGGARANRLASFKFDNCVRQGIGMSLTNPSVAICASQATPTLAPPLALEMTMSPGIEGPVELSVQAPLPPGISVSIQPGNLTPPGQATVVVGANNTAPSLSTLFVVGNASDYSQRAPILARVATQMPIAPTLTVPPPEATNVQLVPTFTWGGVAQATSYRIEVAHNITFSPVFFAESVTSTSLRSPISLPPSATLFWRVRASNVCGDSAYTLASFTTAEM